jgi:hypothetical protein
MPSELGLWLLSEGRVAFIVHVENGEKRTFASATDWPGWSRSGKDEAAALQALLEYGPRYATVLKGSGVKFSPPAKLSELKVTERLKGGSGTDFGAPQRPPAADATPVNDKEFRRLQVILTACWRYFDAVQKRAGGRGLRKGPRGGGRDLGKMVDHVRDAEGAYVAALGWAPASGKPQASDKAMAEVREAAIEGMRASAAGEIPAIGPRGGRRWSPRYFARRAAWHVLDHAWEIEDRIE